MTREYLVDGPVPEGKAITVGQQIAATQVHIQIALAFRAPGTEVHPNHFQINARCGRAVVQDSRSPSDSRGQTFTPPVSWSRPWGGAFQVTLSAAIRSAVYIRCPFRRTVPRPGRHAPRQSRLGPARPGNQPSERRREERRVLAARFSSDPDRLCLEADMVKAHPRGVCVPDRLSRR